jgi:hypothetical protein
VAGFMGQKRAAAQITDGIDPQRSLKVFVGADKTFFQANPKVFQAQPLGIGPAAHSHHDHLRFDLLLPLTPDEEPVFW